MDSPGNVTRTGVNELAPELASVLVETTKDT